MSATPARAYRGCRTQSCMSTRHSAFISLRQSPAPGGISRWAWGTSSYFVFRPSADRRSLHRPAVRWVAMRKVVLRESRLEYPLVRWTWVLAASRYRVHRSDSKPRSGCDGFNHKATKDTKMISYGAVRRLRAEPLRVLRGFVVNPLPVGPLDMGCIDRFRPRPLRSLNPTAFARPSAGLRRLA